MPRFKLQLLQDSPVREDGMLEKHVVASSFTGGVMSKGSLGQRTWIPKMLARGTDYLDKIFMRTHADGATAFLQRSEVRKRQQC